MAFLDGYYNHSNLRMYFYFILFFLNLALIHCASALMGGFFLLLYIMIPAVRKIFQKWNFNFFTILSILLCLILVGVSFFFFSSGKAPQWLYDITRQKRSIMIRLLLWCGITKEIIIQPIFGYGLGEDAAFFARPDTSLTYNAHNAYLQTLHEGGIFTLGAVFAVLALFAHKLKTCQDRKLAGFFAVIVFSDLIMMQSAITSWFTWYPILIIVQIASLVCTEQEVME
ncbi:MAG: O-antigen ligase family protein [Eubacteriales bacterium]|nr:O-antigen ligase family protein [Eubacteriales bacterium]